MNVVIYVSVKRKVLTIWRKSWSEIPKSSGLPISVMDRESSNSTGRPVVSETPEPLGPRKRGQSVENVGDQLIVTNSTQMRKRRLSVPSKKPQSKFHFTGPK